MAVVAGLVAVGLFVGWALEPERHDVAGSTREETIAKDQRLVADLLGAELAPGRTGPAPDRS